MIMGRESFPFMISGGEEPVDDDGVADTIILRVKKCGQEENWRENVRHGVFDDDS